MDTQDTFPSCSNLPRWTCSQLPLWGARGAFWIGQGRGMGLGVITFSHCGKARVCRDWTEQPRVSMAHAWVCRKSHLAWETRGEATQKNIP